MFENFLIPCFQGVVGDSTKKRVAKYENSRTFYMILMRLIDIALDARYSFKNLPETIDERVLKQALLFYGNATFFTLDGVPIALPSAPDGSAFDVYGNAGQAWVFSKNGMLNMHIPLNYKYSSSVLYDKKYLQGAKMGTPKEVGDGVIIWENKSRTPFIWTVLYYAERIADTLRTLDMDRRWLKRPFIPRCEESEGASFDESLKAFMNNEDFNSSLKSRSIDKTDIFTVDLAPELITHVTQLCEWYESQFKMLCGIDSNAQVDKKGENLISSEIDVNNMYIDINTNSIIEYINEQMEVYNTLTGNNIECIINSVKSDMREVTENDENKDISGTGRDSGAVSE